MWRVSGNNLQMVEEDYGMIGDRVRYKGHIYESVMDYNIWSPEAYPAGWKIVDE